MTETSSAVTPPCPSCGHPLRTDNVQTAAGQGFSDGEQGVAVDVSGRCANPDCTQQGRVFGLVQGELVPLDDR